MCVLLRGEVKGPCQWDNETSIPAPCWHQSPSSRDDTSRQAGVPASARCICDISTTNTNLAWREQRKAAQTNSKLFPDTLGTALCSLPLPPRGLSPQMTPWTHPGPPLLHSGDAIGYRPGFKRRGKDYLLSGLGLPPIPVVTGFYEPEVSQLSVAWNRAGKHHGGFSHFHKFCCLN